MNVRVFLLITVWFCYLENKQRISNVDNKIMYSKKNIFSLKKEWIIVDHGELVLPSVIIILQIRFICFKNHFFHFIYNAFYFSFT